MTDLAKNSGVIDAANLLTHYGFDLSGDSCDRLLDRWLRMYPRVWLRPAVIEALYQGRYKAFSVGQILAVWQRRGQPLQHFNHEFERMICSTLPKSADLVEPVADRLAPAPLPPHPEAIEPAAVDKADSLVSTAEPAAASTPILDIESDLSKVNEPDPAKHSGESMVSDRASPIAPVDVAPLSHFPLETPPEIPSEKMPLPPASKTIIHPPIHQFVPATIASEFHSKLKAVAQRDDFPVRKLTSFALLNDATFRQDAQEQNN